MRRKLTTPLVGIFALLVLAAVPVGQRPAAAGTARNAGKDTARDVQAVYQVSVRTGDHDLAGTDANVYIKLVGWRGTFGPVEMDSGHNDFERGSVGAYTFETHELGGLRQVCIWRDNFGAAPDWYLEWVKVGRRTFSFYEWIPSGHERCKSGGFRGR